MTSSSQHIPRTTHFLSLRAAAPACWLFRQPSVPSLTPVPPLHPGGVACDTSPNSSVVFVSGKTPPQPSRGPKSPSAPFPLGTHVSLPCGHRVTDRPRAPAQPGVRRCSTAFPTLMSTRQAGLLSPLSTPPPRVPRTSRWPWRESRLSPLPPGAASTCPSSVVRVTRTRRCFRSFPF